MPCQVINENTYSHITTILNWGLPDKRKKCQVIKQGNSKYDFDISRGVPFFLVFNSLTR